MSSLIPVFMAATGLPERAIRAIISNAPVRYKNYTIPKRSGGRRKVSQPAREVKALQRALMANVLEILPVHSAATAYRQGLSIRSNALAHAGDGPILKFDFKDFFPSLTARDWRLYCERWQVFQDVEDIYISTNILFHRAEGLSGLRLAIGAPSSPCLSNILMNGFDTSITEAVAEDRVRYTRYADDLTFSAPRTGFLTGVEKNLRRVLRETRSPSLVINEDKTVLATRKYRRAVTGLILANDGSVSVGHDRKRTIRAALHHASLGKLDIAELATLSGLLAFIQSVEPDFVAKMMARYGTNLLDRIRAAPRLAEGPDDDTVR